MRITITHDNDIKPEDALNLAFNAEKARAGIADNHLQMVLWDRCTHIMCSCRLKKNGNISVHVWHQTHE